MKSKLSGLLTLCLAFTIFFIACKKDTSTLTASSANENLKATTSATTTAMTSKDGDNPTATLQISEDLFKASLEDGAVVQGEQTGPASYNAIAVINTHTNPPIDPCAQDWINFNNYWNAHITAWQAWANAHCTPVYIAWSGKCLACVLAIVKPNSRNCDVIKYNPTQLVFQ